MEFRIADTFTDSLARLSGEEQKAIKTTAFDLQINPAQPSLSFHRLDKAKDKNFWSVRVSSSVRLIVHRTESSLLLCYVGRHDDAYQWAERRKLEAHPITGAAQLVEIRERIEEVFIPRYIEVDRLAPPKPLLFARIPDSDLLGYGVPAEWVEDVRAANEDTVLDLADHLPKEAAEALLELAVGKIPQVFPIPRAAVRTGDAIGGLVSQLPYTGLEPRELTDGFAHPDAQRRFRTIDSLEELERALEYPWEKWTVFLHPAQRESVERDYGGPARISGSAGTGKTIVALHRAVFLARNNPDPRVLLTTFSDTLANALKTRLRRLIGNEPRIAERIEVYSVDEIAERLYRVKFERPQIASSDNVKSLLAEAAESSGAQKFTPHFLESEWEGVVDAWQLDSWESYRDVARLGRKTRLPEKRRELLWEVFKQVRAGLNEPGLITKAELMNRLASAFTAAEHAPYDFVAVDEAQDVSVAQLRFLAALGKNRPNSLFFAGDLGQRIFQ